MEKKEFHSLHFKVRINEIFPSNCFKFTVKIFPQMKIDINQSCYYHSAIDRHGLMMM